MDYFMYKSKYDVYSNCYFQVGRYVENNNLAITIWNTEEGPICDVTVNPSIPLKSPIIAIKDYSENEGMVDWLISEGLIEETPVKIVGSGWIEIPCHRMTPKMINLL